MGSDYLFANSSSSLSAFSTQPAKAARLSDSTELVEVVRSSRRISQIIPTVRFRGDSCPLGAIEPIETQHRDQIGSRDNENQRTSQ
jgi:hypothetical protein